MNGISKDQKPPLKPELTHSKSNSANQFIKNIAKTEKAFTDKPKTSVSPQRSLSPKQTSNLAISKANTKKTLTKTSNSTSTDQLSRPKSTMLAKPKKESKIEDEIETQLLAEKLGRIPCLQPLT